MGTLDKLGSEWNRRPRSGGAGSVREWVSSSSSRPVSNPRSLHVSSDYLFIALREISRWSLATDGGTVATYRRREARIGEVIETFAWMSRLEGPVGALRQRGPADPFVAAMRRSREPTERLALAFSALEHDEDCIEANLVVAGSCSDVNRRLLYLNIAVEAGESLWGQLEHRYDVGAMPGITPWLWSLKALGQTLEGVGDLDSAADCYRRLSQLDEDDVHEGHMLLNHLRERISKPKP